MDNRFRLERGRRADALRAAFRLGAALLLTLLATAPAWAQRSNRPVDAPNPVRIETEPAGAKIRVDGKVVVDPDETTLLLPPGEYTIHVSKGGSAATQRIKVIQGEAGYVKLALTPQDASLRVDSDPAGSEVKVDGKSIGVTPLTVKLPPGTHQIEVSQIGYPAATAPVELDAGWETGVRVDLAQEQLAHAVWARPSTWSWQRRTAVGVGLVALFYAFVEVDAINTSNTRQDKLRSDANSATIQSTYDDLVRQIQDERKRGQAHQEQATFGYALAIAAAGLAWWFDKPGEGPAKARFEVTAAPGPDGRPLLAMQWKF